MASRTAQRAERRKAQTKASWGFTLDHVNIRTHDLERLVSFYEKTLGLERGARPPFGFPGAWLYAGDRAVVHLIGVASAPEAPKQASGLRLEHYALSAGRGVALDDFLAHLDRLGVEAQVVTLPDGSTTQVNIWDPDGNHLHLDFEPS